MPLVVRSLDEDGWRVVRTLRLAALADSPSAFGSTLAAERALTEEVWRRRTPSYVVALDGDDPVGMAGGWVDPASPGSAQLVGMWVAPSHRRRGVGEALVRAVVDRAWELGVEDVRLWVTVGNDAARRLYERCEFVATGERAPLPSDPALWEERMARRRR